MEGNPKNYDDIRDRPKDLPDDQLDYWSLDGSDKPEFPLPEKAATVAMGGYESVTHPDEAVYQDILSLAGEENFEEFGEKIKSELKALKASQTDLDRIDTIVKNKDVLQAQRVTRNLYNEKRLMEKRGELGK